MKGIERLTKYTLLITMWLFIAFIIAMIIHLTTSIEVSDILFMESIVYIAIGGLSVLGGVETSTYLREIQGLNYNNINSYRVNEYKEFEEDEISEMLLAGIIIMALLIL